MKKYAPAGAVLFWIAVAAIVAIIGWMLWSLPGWMEGWRLGRVAGIVVLVGLGAVILFAVPVAVMALYALIGVGLESLGVRLEQPAPPAELTDEEEAHAARTEAHSVWYVYKEEDSVGHEVSYGALVSVHPGRDAAEAERAARSGPPWPGMNPNGEYRLFDPWNLLAASLSRWVGTAGARELLRGGRIEKGRNSSPDVWGMGHLRVEPLSREQFRRANEVQVWTVYYEDRFSGSPQARSGYGVAICFSEADARAEVERRGPIEARSVGHGWHGPGPLAASRTPEIGTGRVLEILARLERDDRSVVQLHTGP